VIVGRSACPLCSAEIKWYDNIPILSFILLKSRCRYCNGNISPQYLLVEIISGVGFILIFLLDYSISAKVFLSALLILYLIIFFIDIKHFIIPDELSFTIIALAFIKNFLPSLHSHFTHDITQSVAGGLLGYFSIWIVIFIYRKLKNTEAMGLGDAKLMAGIGLLFGWEVIPLVLFIAAMIGLVMVIPSLLKGKRNLQSQIPFGPYIISAGIVYFIFGNSLYQAVFVI